MSTARERQAISGDALLSQQLRKRLTWPELLRASWLNPTPDDADYQAGYDDGYNFALQHPEPPDGKELHEVAPGYDWESVSEAWLNGWLAGSCEAWNEEDI